jgi:hypothetical protein
MEKATFATFYFREINEREATELKAQMEVIRKTYGDLAKILDPLPLGSKVPEEADGIIFPQMIFAAYRHDEDMERLKGYPIFVITSRFGTVEMWDWEIITYLRDKGLEVFSPYSVELGKTLIRALSAKKTLNKGAKFLMFQDNPGEGMQPNIFKKFYWWEKQSTEEMENRFGCDLVYYSWKKVCQDAREISDEEALPILEKEKIRFENLSEAALLKPIKLYIAVKKVIAELGGVEAVGSNCLNESFSCDTTPCFTWNMLLERDHILWACEGDTLSMLSTFILYRSLEKPIMMTNLYPFLVGMAALAHERIKDFPDIPDPANHALGVHCGYFGLVQRQFADSWVLKPKTLAIVPEDSCMIDATFPKGPVTLAKIYPGFRKISLIKSEIEGYVQYPGSDTLNGALIHYQDGYKVMDNLCSHHSLIIVGDQIPMLLQVSKIFGFEPIVM